jgi:peptide/nickel transport system substrate-binding protein
MAGLWMLSRKAAAGASSADFDSGKAAVGTGPYRFSRFVRGDRVELARNDGYWGGGSSWEKVTFRMITADAPRVAALLAGDVQMVEQVGTADVARIKARSDLAVFTGPSYRMIHFHLDSSRDRTPFAFDKAGRPLDRNPFRDVRVRQAFSRAIDRNTLVARVMEGAATPAAQFVPEGFFGYVPELKPEPYDPAGARKLLAEAGYPDGFALTLHGPNNRYVNDEQIVQTVAQMLARVGIAAKVETMPMSVYLGRGHKQEFTAALLGWGVVTGEASYSLRALVATVSKEKGMGTFNWGRYSNPAMDRQLEQALATVDDPKRSKLLQEATTTVLTDYGLIPLHNQVNVWAARAGLTYTPRIDERTYAHEVRPAR